MPSFRATSRVGMAWMSAPSSSTHPAAIGSSRASDFSSVDLPQALGPTSAVIRPVGMAAERQAQRVHRGQQDERPGHRRERRAEGERRGEQEHGRRPGPGARRDPDDVRGGQRVTDRPLVQRARQPEQCTGEQRGQGAGHPDPEDHVVGQSGPHPERRGQHVGGVDPPESAQQHRGDEQGGQHHHEHRDGQDRTARPGPPVGAQPGQGRGAQRGVGGGDTCQQIHHTRTRFRRRASQTKNGVPTTAVITPTWISP